MTVEQNINSDTGKRHFGTCSTRAQERNERWMAKQDAREARRAAREARHMARAQRPRRDWTFEVKIGEKVYTFSWRWHPGEPQPQAASDASAEAPEAGNAPDASITGQ